MQGLLWALMGAALLGGVFLVVNRPQDPAITIILPTPTVSGPVKVYISGAVAVPGVYTLAPESRAEALLQSAGGPLPDADLSAVNLAQVLRDGQQVHVPSQGEALSAAVSAPSGGLVNINSATAEKLEALPGIGEVRAGAIVAYREAHGPFQRLDALLDVPGIGPVTYESIKALVTLE